VDRKGTEDDAITAFSTKRQLDAHERIMLDPACRRASTERQFWRVPSERYESNTVKPRSAHASRSFTSAD